MQEGDSSSLRYALSFTSGGLLLRESMVALAVFETLADWALVREQLMRSNDLQQRTVQSRRTISREVVGRLSQLGEDELGLLGEAGPQERESILWLATCRRYAILGEFAEEVVRERFLLLTPSVSKSDFDAFLRGKAVWHPEVLDLSDSTRAKLGQNAFRMLREAGLLSSAGEVLRVVLSRRLLDLLSEHSPFDLRFFPTDQGGDLRER